MSDQIHSLKTIQPEHDLAEIELISQSNQETEGETLEKYEDIDQDARKQSESLNDSPKNQTRGEENLITSDTPQTQRQIYNWILFNVLGLLLILCNQMFISQKCNLPTESECEDEFFDTRKYIWLIQAIINAAVITVWFFKFIEFNRMSPYYAGLIILGYVIIQTFGDEVGTRVYTGFINFISLQIFLQFIQIGMGPVIKKRCSKYIKKILLCVACCILIAATIIIPKLRNSVQCNSWSSGINGGIKEYDIQKDINNQYGDYKPLEEQSYCSILTPSTCWYYSLDFIFNVQRFFPQHTCQNINYTVDTLDYFFDTADSHRYIGFPSQLKTEEQEMDYQSMVLQQAQGYNSIKDAVKSGHEVILDKYNFKYSIQVSKNTTLASERKKISEEKQTESIAENILLINVNGLSRIQMHAKLPQTLSWLKKFNTDINLENNTVKEDSYYSLEYMRYNSFNHRKDIQSLQFFYGQADFAPGTEEVDSVFDFFKNEGYITGYSNTFCKASSYEKQRQNDQYLKPIVKDHDSSSTFACDPNYEDPEQSFKWIKGSESYFTRCLYGEQIQTYAFNYTKSFFDQYSENKKFFMLEFAEGRERTGQVVRNIDEELAQFLESNEHLLENTFIILMSSQSQPEKQTLFSKLSLKAEKISRNLPFLLMRLPKTLKDQYKKSLIENTQKLLTIRNVHFTLKHLANGTNFNQYEESLLISQRTYNQCPDVGISKKDCSCEYPIQY